MFLSLYIGFYLLLLSTLHKIFELEYQLFVKEKFYLMGRDMLRVFSEQKIFAHLTKFKSPSWFVFPQEEGDVETDRLIL